MAFETESIAQKPFKGAQRTVGTDGRDLDSEPVAEIQIDVDALARDSRREDQFRQSVRRHFSFLKNTNSLDSLWIKSIPLADNSGFLIPLCSLHQSDRELIGVLTDWRNEFAFAYPTQFKATPASTSSWLGDRLLAVEDRILFLVVSKIGEVVGHIGLANALAGLEENRLHVEIDNVVRGKKGAHPGIMSAALKALVEWADQMLVPDQIFLRVFRDNDHAIEFYKRNGFVEDQIEPLRKFETKDSVVFKALEPQDRAPADREFLRMIYRPESFPKGEKLILTAGPSISGLEKFYTFDAAATGWNNNWSSYLTKFEKAFAGYVGVQHALATSSCTGALHLALEALGIGPGDEVIVPDITWVASANVVTYVGAIPIFADVDEKTWVLDPKSFEKKITDRTKAVIPVHLYGHPAPMDEIVEIARRHGLYIVEDAAPSIGATFKGRKTGGFGDFAAFSFQGAKLTVTGEGGMLVTNNTELYEKVKRIWDQGRDPHKTLWISEKGWKYKMSNVQAALGLAQLELVEELIASKRRVFSWYYERLQDLKTVRMCLEPEQSRSIYWMSSIQVLDGARVTRDELRSALRELNVDSRPVFPAISQYPIWPVAQEPQVVARAIGDSGLNLPSGVCLKEDEIDYVCRMIRKVIQE